MIKVRNVALALNQWYKYKGAECRVTGLAGDSAVMVVVVGPPMGSGEFLVPKRELTNDRLVRYQGLPGYELEHGYEYREFDNGADTVGWDFLPNNERTFWERSTGQAPKNVYLYRRKLITAHAPGTTTPVTATVTTYRQHHITCDVCKGRWMMEGLRETNTLFCPHCGKQNKVTV